MNLLVRVIEARNIPAMDPNGLTDPYVKLQLGEHRFRSKVVKKSLNPSWCEEFSFRVDDLKDKLVISVLDEDKYFNDDFVGQIKIPVARVFDAPDKSLGTAWYSLQPKNKKGKNKEMKECGEILIIYCCQTVEEEDMMADFRKDLIVLLRSIVRVAPDVTQLFIKNSLDSAVASPPDRIVEEVEAALTLFYSLGESLTDEAIKTGKGLLGELVPMLLSTQFSCLSNRLVALVYLDTITRFMRFVQQNTQYIPMVLRAFLDERGIHHPNVNVSRRASYLFMRAVRLLKTQLVPYIETILQSLQDKVAHFTNMGPVSDKLLKADDGSHMFEAIGILIGMEDVPFEKHSEYLSALLTPLCQQVKMVISKAKVQHSEESSVEIDNIQHIIMAINSLSKGFSERLVIEKLCR